MNILITEEQFKRLVSGMVPEGIAYNKSGNWGVDVNIDSDQTDSGNTGFDTRLFGTANNILNGDNTKGNRFRSFKRRQESFSEYAKFLQALKLWVENGRNGEPPNMSKIDSISASAVRKNLKLDDESLLQWIDTTLSRVMTTQQIRTNKYNVAMSSNGEDKIARYNVGVVPGTNVKVITLFDFDDFNVSDVIKNGYMRQNDTTDNIFGLSKETRPVNPSLKGKATNRTVPVTYNGMSPNIQGNFSLNGIEGDNDHFNRVSYGMNDKSYHSVVKFIDKSINYAQYALKKENIQADYILCAPSSSKFNIYYSKRLQDKTGIPFINGFFEKKIVNVRFDREGMESEGISSESINSFEKSVKNAAMKEISNGIAKPLKEFVDMHWDLFSNIAFDVYKPSFKGRRPKTPRPEEIKYLTMAGSKVQKSQVFQVIATNAFNSLSKMIEQPGSRFDDNACKIILRQLGKEFSSSVFNIGTLSKDINRVITENCMQEFTAAIRKMAWLVAQYHSKLLSGFTPNFDGTNFKVTKFSKNVRKYLKGAFVIADAQLNKDKNLFTRYAGKKYLIFDEDMNSGATLAMLADALMDYGINESDITCLVNGYSTGGF